ncbi:hypothetical protein IW262DRAFT_1453324 [Armillaria fumosa]|nr:hypothetical protein IW262DRAFT_1453324 [Armillaria fumosa]
MDQTVLLDEEVDVLKDVRILIFDTQQSEAFVGPKKAINKTAGLYIKIIRDAETGDDWIIMKNVALGPPPMSDLDSLIARTRTFEECRDPVREAIQRSAETIMFWVEKKGYGKTMLHFQPELSIYETCSHEDPISGNTFFSNDMSQIVLIDYGRSERAVELTDQIKKPSVGPNAPTVAFPALRPPQGVSQKSKKATEKAPELQSERRAKQFRGAGITLDQ